MTAAPRLPARSPGRAARVLLALLIPLTLPAGPRPGRLSAEEDGAATPSVPEPVLEFAPPPDPAAPRPTAWSFGRQRGEAERKAIRAFVREVQTLTGGRGERAEAPSGAGWPEPLLAELQGLAEGAGVPVQALVAAQAWTAPLDGAQGSDAEPVALGALGEATSMGQALHLATLPACPWPPVRDRARLEVLEPSAGHAFAWITYPGQIAATQGLNAHGLSLSCERFALPDPGTEAGLPPALLVRLVLEHDADLEQATRRLSETPLRGGARFLLVDGRRREARVIERAGTRFHVRRDVDGLLWQRDPLARLECFVGACDPDLPRGADEPRAYPALHALLGPLQRRLRASLLAPALAAPGVLHPHAPAAVLLEPETLTLSVAEPPDQGGLVAWRRWRLEDLLPERLRVQARRPAFVSGPGTVRTRTAAARFGEVELRHLTFDSPAPSGHAQNDLVQAVYYVPPGAKGAVIVLPAWKESSLAGQGLVALRLAQAGYAALVLPLPWQVSRAPRGVGSGAWTLSEDLARTRAAFHQGAADVARASLWLEQAEGHPPARQGVLGVSLGGHVAALAFGAYPERFAAGCFLLAGGRMDQALLHDNPTTGRLRAALLGRGVTPEEARGLIQDIDPLSWADPRRGPGVLLVGADQDEVIPPANVQALSQAYGGARLEWLPGGHYAILTHLTRTLDWVVQHLEARLGPTPQPR